MAFGRSVSTLLVLVFSLAVCVFAGRDFPESGFKLPTIPASIAVPPGYKLHVVYSAVGFQYYKFNGTSWVNNNASAVLSDCKHHKVGRHFFLTNLDPQGGRPTWETLPAYGVPFSRVTAKAISTAKVSKGSIAWVLLKATTTSGDKDLLGAVSYVQRIKTMNGLPPSSTEGVSLGHITKSPYTALYAYYVRA